MTLASDYDNDDLNPYRVRSRREIIALLRSMSERNQLVRMLINHGVDTIVTSILKVDESSNSVILDCAPSATMNLRILESESLSFETVLESIRILFTSPAAQSCTYGNLPAFIIPLPTNVIRLQRREYYRVPTPLGTPIHCTIPMTTADGGKLPVVVTLHNISGGGISIVDDKKLLDSTIGVIYENCTIELSSSSTIAVSLQVRNLLELTLTNGKIIHRIGMQFVQPSNATLSSVQKYITKLEREQNSKATGLG